MKLSKGGIIVIVCIAIAIVFTYFALKPKTVQMNPNEEYHIHPSIRMAVCGQSISLPKNIGTPLLHTHEDVPYLHVEGAPAKLGDYFKIIKTRFNASCFGNYCNGDKCPLSQTPGQLKVSINGTQNFEYDQYQLRDRDDILIEFN